MSEEDAASAETVLIYQTVLDIARTYVGALGVPPDVVFAIAADAARILPGQLRALEEGMILEQHRVGGRHPGVGIFTES